MAALFPRTVVAQTLTLAAANTPYNIWTLMTTADTALDTSTTASFFQVTADAGNSGNILIGCGTLSGSNYGRSMAANGVQAFGPYTESCIPVRELWVQGSAINQKINVLLLNC